MLDLERADRATTCALVQSCVRGPGLENSFYCTITYARYSTNLAHVNVFGPMGANLAEWPVSDRKTFRVRMGWSHEYVLN